MRERSTWRNANNGTGRQAATNRRAEEESKNQDIYDMNFDGKRVNPAGDAYIEKGPETWMESEKPVKKQPYEEEYDKDGTKRNDIGFAEFRDDTFKRPAWGDSKKYDNRTASERKAIASHQLASSLLKTEDKETIRKVAIGFMALPDQTLATALQAVHSASPAALSDDARYKRAMACTKLAARTLGDGADEAAVERLARTMFQIDDGTLRAMVKIVATAKIAGDEGEGEKKEEKKEEKEDKTASEKKDDKKDDKKEEKKEEPPKVAEKKEEKKEEKAPPPPPAPVAQQQEQQAPPPAPPAPVAQQQEQAPAMAPVAEEMCWGEAGLDPAAQAMMSQMMPPAAPAPGVGDLFAAPPAPPAPVVPMVAASVPEITFDDMDAAPAPAQNHQAAELENLFADDSEVQAQRQFQAAAREQAARAGGFNITASSHGAKKLGAVTRTDNNSPSTQLESLWR